MKSIKQFLILISFLYLSQNIFSQKTKIGFIGGMNLYKMTNINYFSINNLESNPGKKALGYHFGINLNFQLSKHLEFEPELIYSLKGVKLDFYHDDALYTATRKEETKLHFLDIPLMLKLGSNIGTFKVFGNLGPYLGVGISGEHTVDKKQIAKEPNLYSYNSNYTHKINWKWSGSSNSRRSFKRFDYGLGFGLGLSYKAFQLKGIYNVGLAEITYSSKNNGLRISIGYTIQKEREEAHSSSE